MLAAGGIGGDYIYHETRRVGRFGFTATYSDDETLTSEGWSHQINCTITLPHQCGDWAIAGTADGEGRGHIAEALADLDAFIAEAKECRRLLAAQEWATPEELAAQELEKGI